MKRPSFQFYPADWSSNPNLKRCTFAEKGVWLEVMCLLHDQDEYGVLRWPLQEIATAAKCRVADLKSLHRKGVMKGDDRCLSEPFVYVPRSGRKDGAPVTLVAAQEGPIWFSSRMVKDEYVRGLRAEGGASDSANRSPEGSPKTSPKPPLGVAFGPRGSSSSSPSAEEGSEDKSSAQPRFRLDDPSASAWELAKTLLTEHGGLTDQAAGAFFGRLLSVNKIEAREMLSALAQAVNIGTKEPKGYLTKAAEAISRRKTETAAPSKRVGFV